MSQNKEIKKYSQWCELNKHNICTGIFIYKTEEFKCVCQCHDNNGGNIRTHPLGPTPSRQRKISKEKERELELVK